MMPPEPPACHPGDWNQLSLGADSGAIGRSGGAFGRNFLRLNMHCYIDKIHRLIRDIKLAAEHTEGGQMHKAVMHMSYVWSLSQKPWHQGTWHEVKVG